MNMRGSKNLREIATMEGVHDLIHALLEDGKALEFVNEAIADYKQTNAHLDYSDFGSGLHLHLLTHALGWQWPVYFRTPDGTEYKATHVERRTDELERVDRALIFTVEEADG